MANVSWSFYRSRRRIDVQRLVQTGRVADYPTFVAYCSSTGVIPASQQEFDVEFGPILKGPVEQAVSVQVSAPQPNSSDSSSGLEATVWLAGVDEQQERPAPAPPPRQQQQQPKKKKTKDSNEGSES